MTGLCQSEGCDRESRCIAAGIQVCLMHYKRWKRRGDFSRTKSYFAPLDEKRVCSVGDCGEVEDGWCGMCKRHDTRRRRGANLTVITHQRDRDLPRGPDHPAWNETPNYRTVHQRIRKSRGSASVHTCSCGKPAAQWAYQHTGIDEHRELIEGCFVAFSSDIEQYKAMCVSCHKRFDLARIRGVEA